MLRWCRADDGCSGAADAQRCLSHWPLGENALFLHPKEDLALPQWILQVFEGDTSLIPRLSRRCGSSVYSVTRTPWRICICQILVCQKCWTELTLSSWNGSIILLSYFIFSQHHNAEKSFVKTKFKSKWTLRRIFYWSRNGSYVEICCNINNCR